MALFNKFVKDGIEITRNSVEIGQDEDNMPKFMDRLRFINAKGLDITIINWGTADGLSDDSLQKEGFPEFVVYIEDVKFGIGKAFRRKDVVEAPEKIVEIFNWAWNAWVGERDRIKLEFESSRKAEIERNKTKVQDVLDRI